MRALSQKKSSGLPPLLTLIVLLASLSILPMLSMPVAHASPALLTGGTPQPYTFAATNPETTDLGFNACDTPRIDQMQALYGHNGLKWASVQIGGANLGTQNCILDPLTPAWTQAVQAQGWGLQPAWYDLMAPCRTGVETDMSADPTMAFQQGETAASNAATTAKQLGIGPQSILWDDMEDYPTGNFNCDQAVAKFVDGWATELHALGFNAGVYESAGDANNPSVSNPQKLCDNVQSGYIQTSPDAIWVSKLDDDSSQADIASLPPTTGCWTHSRLHQYNKTGTDGVCTKLIFDGVSGCLDSADGPVSIGNPSYTANKWVGRNSAGGLEAFKLDSTNHIAQNSQASAGSAFGGWVDIPNPTNDTMASDPAVGQNTNGTLLLVARGASAKIYVNQENTPGTWTGWSAISNNNTGITMQGTPAVAPDFSGNLVAIIRGDDGRAYVSTQTTPAGNWTAWSAFSKPSGDTLAGDPALGQNANGTLVVFARGASNRMWVSAEATTRNFSAFAVVSANPTGVMMLGTPAAGRDFASYVQVVARGSDGDLYISVQTTVGGPSWTAWSPFSPPTGDTFAGDPTMGRNSNGTLLAFARGNTGVMWVSSQGSSRNYGHFSAFSNPTSPPSPPNTTIVGDPAVCRDGNGALRVFARGSDATMEQASQSTTTGNFTAFGSIGGSFP